MRKSLILILIITIISALILIVTIKMAHPFSFEGELDPNVFAQWPRVSQGMVTPVIGKIIVQNPDRSSPVQKIQIIVFVPREIIIAYQYFKNGEIFRYELDFDEDRYKRAYFDEAQRKRCMKCHVNQIRPTEMGRSAGGVYNGLESSLKNSR